MDHRPQRFGNHVARIRVTMGRGYILAGQMGACAWVLAGAASCVPKPERQTARAEQALVDAAPLLRRLDLEVPDLSPADLMAPAGGFRGAMTPPPFVAAMRSADDQARALECLAQAVYHEARSESEDGQRAVAQVVLNRVRDRAFPVSVCGVVYQGSHRATGCQFSFTCDGSLARRIRADAWARARAIAQDALNGYVYAPVGSATHYHADYVSPWWAPSLARIGAVGAHVFYRWKGALERALTFRQAYAGAEPGVSERVPGPANGVTVAYGSDGRGGEGGVTVHRGSFARPDAVAPVARTAVSAGVRVHRHRGAAPDAEAWSGAYGVDGATIGEEADPI